MKRFLLFIVLSLIFNMSKAQTVTHQDWKIENAGQWSSFYWGVSRTQYPDFQGKYYYYVYFYSNSYFGTKSRDGANYDRAITYIRDVRIYMDEYMYANGRTAKFNTVSVSSPYITCDWVTNQNQYAAWFYSFQPYNRFYITFGKASAYDHSMY